MFVRIQRKRDEECSVLLSEVMYSERGVVKSGDGEWVGVPCDTIPRDTHLRLESHVEHAVCLVHHNNRSAPHIGHPSVVRREHVDHSTGRACHKQQGLSTLQF